MITPLCIAPWANIDITPMGSVAPCCVYDTDDSHDVYDIAKWFDSNELKKLKEDLLAGIKPSKCNFCWRKESLGEHSSSMRNIYNSMFLHKVDLNLSTHESIQGLDLKLGNQCNLKCIMCSPSNSDKILEEQLKTAISEDRKTYLLNIKEKTKWPMAFDLTALPQMFPNVTYIKMTGGEPFVNPYLIPTLNKFNNKESIRLHVTTNLTLLNMKLLNCLSQFKEIIITISLDGINEVFEFIRQPASWETFSDNLETLIRYKSQPTLINPVTGKPKFNINFNCTMQASNILDLHNIIKFVASKKNTRLSLQPVHPVHSPFALAAVDDITKQKSIDRIEALPDSVEKKIALVAIKSAVYSDDAYNLYKSAISKISSSRQAIIPESVYF